MGMTKAWQEDLKAQCLGALTSLWLQWVQPEPISPGLALVDFPDGERVLVVEMHGLDMERDRVKAVLHIDQVLPADTTLDRVMEVPETAVRAAEQASNLFQMKLGRPW